LTTNNTNAEKIEILLFSDQEAKKKKKMVLNLSRRHHIIFSLLFGAMHVFYTVQDGNTPTLSQ